MRLGQRHRWTGPSSKKDRQTTANKVQRLRRRSSAYRSPSLASCRRSDHSHRTLLRVYAGPRTPEALLIHPSLQDNAHLPVPVTDKNFLISPPGSPPVGWEQIREDPPNADTLADDLMRALEGLGAANDEMSDDVVEERSSSATGSGSSSRRETLILTAPEDESTPCVLVSDLDPDVRSTSGLTIANTPNGIRRTPTPRPGDISQVRATVDSMAGPSRITPTSRPPLA